MTLPTSRSYDPDGLVNYMKLKANDNCDYILNGDSAQLGNRMAERSYRSVDWYSLQRSPHPAPERKPESIRGLVALGAAWRMGRDDRGAAPVKPVAGFTGTPVSGTAPLTVTFTDTSTNTPTSWTWSFGDGSSVNATAKNPIHTYTAPVPTRLH